MPKQSHWLGDLLLSSRCVIDRRSGFSQGRLHKCVEFGRRVIAWEKAGMPLKDK